MKSKRTGGGALSALLTFVLLLVGVVAPAGTAAANDLPRFNLTASSVRIGGSVLVTEADPCPPPVEDDMGTLFGHVVVGVIDANGVNRGRGTAQLDSQGHWGQVWVSVDARRARSLSPPTFKEVAAPGVAQLTGRCVVPGTNVSYETQSVTLTDSSPYVTHGSGVIGRSLQVTPSEPCPSGSDVVRMMANDEDTNDLTQQRAVSDNDAWELEIPDWYPQHSISLRVECMQGQSIRQSYDDVITELVYDAHRYVAMGDSYSSGVGTFNYDASSGSCRRSSESYVSYVTAQRNLGTPFFIACGGAQTADFYGQNPVTGEARQLNALTNATRYATLTVGGNDVGFAGVMESCSHYPNHNGWGCANDSSLVNDLNQRIDALAGTTTKTAADGRQIRSLEQVYADIANAAPHAKIYVGGYPRLFGSNQSDYIANGSAPGGSQCVLATGVTVSYSDAQWLNQMADELNSVIEGAVSAAQANGVDVTYVPADLFDGHGLCDSDTSWLNGAVLDESNQPQVESLHPNSEGYSIGYGPAFAAIMN